MRYRKGGPLTSDTPFSRLIWDILIVLIRLLGWPLSRAMYNIKIEKVDAMAGHRLPSRAILISNHCMPLDPLSHGLANFPAPHLLHPS
jgi:1-acyl-sn-glycerol-3-phosphate acyltransferase